MDPTADSESTNLSTNQNKFFKCCLFIVNAFFNQIQSGGVNQFRPNLTKKTGKLWKTLAVMVKFKNRSNNYKTFQIAISRMI